MDKQRVDDLLDRGDELQKHRHEFIDGLMANKQNSYDAAYATWLDLKIAEIEQRLDSIESCKPPVANAWWHSINKYILSIKK